MGIRRWPGYRSFESGGDYAEVKSVPVQVSEIPFPE